MTLRRAVEAAGMLEHCDFEEQKTVPGDDGYVRPDMVVNLPGGGQVVIDAKVPLDAFLQFTEADDDDARQALLEKHAKQLRTHIDQLAKKEYWRQFERSPEFVVAFIPGEPLLAAALDADSGLQDHALDKRVILATPNTLVAALRTIALSWQQETLAENAREVKELGTELYERLRTWTGHMQALQKSLTSSVDAYNRAVGSLESRVLVTARKFPTLGVVGSERTEITELSPIETAPRHLQAVEADDEHEVVQENILPLPDGSGARGTGA
jgi:DNA recombination protein RmuC